MATLTKPAERMKRLSEPKMTSAEFLALPEDYGAAELIHGELWMAPPPNMYHQQAVGELFVLLRQHTTQSGKLRAFVSPVGLQLGEDLVLQPDLMVVTADHPDVLAGGAAFTGIPLLVVEVLSRSTAEYDRRDKYSLYQIARVPNYWIVDPQAKTIDAFALVDGVYAPAGQFTGSGAVLLPPMDQALDFANVFPWKGSAQ